MPAAATSPVQPLLLASLLPDLHQLLQGRRWSQAVLAARQHLAAAAAAAVASGRQEGDGGEPLQEEDGGAAEAAVAWPAAGLAAAAAARATTSSSSRGGSSSSRHRVNSSTSSSLVSAAAEEVAAWRGLAVALLRGLDSPEAAYTACCRGLDALGALQRQQQQLAANAARPEGSSDSGRELSSSAPASCGEAGQGSSDNSSRRSAVGGAGGSAPIAGQRRELWHLAGDVAACWERELLSLRLDCLSAVARGDSHAVRARLNRSGLLTPPAAPPAAAAPAPAAAGGRDSGGGDAAATSQEHRHQRLQRYQQGEATGSGPAAAHAPLLLRPRVFVLSDVHADAAMGGGGGGGRVYMDLLRRVSTTQFQHDVVLVAGDVADTLPATREALRLLKQRFGRVFFTPGNHDLWLRPGLEDGGGGGNSGLADSFAKLWALWDACDELGVEVVPAEVAPGVLVAPLLSWYRHTFDTADPAPGRLRFDSWCRWPVAEADVWQVMLRLNDVALAAARTWRRQVVACGRQQEDCSTGTSTSTRVGGGRQQPQRHHVGPQQAPPPKQQQNDAAAAPPAASAPAPALPPAVAAPDSPNTPPHHSSSNSAASGGVTATPSTTAGAPPLVVTLTHFLPHPDLPFPRLPHELAKAVGCAELQHVLAMAGSSVHVYGHSHVATDTWLPAAAAGGAGGGGGGGAGAGGKGGASAGAGCAGSVSGGGGHSGEARVAARDLAVGRRYVHWPLHGQRRVVLRCIWDPARGQCSYDVNGENGLEDGCQ